MGRGGVSIVFYPRDTHNTITRLTNSIASISVDLTVEQKGERPLLTQVYIDSLTCKYCRIYREITRDP